MISEIRTYFKQAIKEIDSDLKFDGYVTDVEKIGASSLNNSYKFLIGAMASTQDETEIESTLPVTVIFYMRSGTDIVEDFDKNYCKAIDLQALVTDLTRVTQTTSFKSVKPVSITPSDFETNDKTIRFTLEFNVTLIYKN